MIRGDVRRKNGDLDGALGDYSHGIEHTLLDTQCLIRRANVYLDKDDVASAHKDYMHASKNLEANGIVRSRDDFVEFNALRARIKLMTGRDPELSLKELDALRQKFLHKTLRGAEGREP